LDSPFCASWIVTAEDGRPTGYEPHQMHPALFRKTDVISSKLELLMRMSAWKAKRKG
jgi:hypothetical protein